MSDHWDFYSLRVDNEIASIMVDLGLRSLVPLKTHKYMGYLRTHMNNPQPNGLSSQDEFDKLCQIGDTIENSIDASGGLHLYVGRNTSSNNRDFYFYTCDSEQLDRCLREVIQKFPDYRFTKGGRDDAEWSTYLNFLHPNPSQEQQIMDRRVCEYLKSQGDDLSIVREIDHRVYFTNKSKMKLFEQYLGENEFIKIQIGKTKPLLGDHFVDFVHLGAPKDIFDVVYDLFYKSQELDGVYDGWGCNVQKVIAN